MKEVTIETHIRKMSIPDKYKVIIQWNEGGSIFTDDNDGKGYFLYQAEHILLVMHAHIKSSE